MISSSKQENTMRLLPSRIHFATGVCAAIILCWAWSAAGQTFTVLADLNGTDGSVPSTLVQATDGNFYGTAFRGGAFSQGSIFKISPAGILTSIYSFCGLPSCADGLQPTGPLVLGRDGNLYGTATGGGAQNKGTFFKIGYDGTLTTLYSFCSLSGCSDGAFPTGSVVLGSDGNFYGVTEGVTSITFGTIYRMTPSGTVTTLYQFCSKTNCADGTTSRSGLARDRGNTIYGTTPDGGLNGNGTIFRIGTDGKFFKTLHNFCSGGGACPDGSIPSGPLLVAFDGNIYGTAGSGGTNSSGAAFSMNPSGGGYSLVYSFCPTSGCLDGTLPQSGLFEATDGNFYGTTVEGGFNGWGVLFRLTSTGTETRLHSFHTTNGALPNTQAVQGTDGNIYGTTSNGGPRNPKLCGNVPLGCGTIFRQSMGRAFVKSIQLDGQVGNTVIILGYGLTGSTSVTFNGTTATYTVVSDTQISATVPSGATTGTIQVTTPGGTLVSNVKFEVLP
jgi:uncharacterized repeat protein (TIGR03803 family)